MSEPIGYQIGAQRTIPGDLQDPLANEHFMETAGIEPAVCFGRVTLMPVARPCSPEGFPLTRDGLLDDGYQQLNCCLDSGHDGPHYDPVARLEWTPRQDREATA